MPMVSPRTRALLALAIAAPVVAAPLVVGCGAGVKVPPYRERGVLADQVVRPDPANSDVRTIDDAADEVEGPVSPTGVELPAGRVDSASLGPILASDSGPAAQPADGEAGRDAGQPQGYRTVGGVLLESNGTAIFTDDVIAARHNQLRGLARKLPPPQFRQAAEREIKDETGRQLQELLTRNVVGRETSAADKRLARALTAVWRERFITDHGGSEALARAAARDLEGLSLEKLVDREHDRRLGEIFLRNRVAPAARPSAQDVRDEFRRLLDAGELDVPGTIDFALIELRPDDVQDADRARAKAAALRDRAEAGEDFAELARAHSADPAFAARGGLLPESLRPLQKDSYALIEVEAAAWATPAGSVADAVVEMPGTSGPAGSPPRFYVVKVLEKREPRTLGFAEVAGRIGEMLTQRRQAVLMQGFLTAERARLSLPPEADFARMLTTAMEVAEQNYPHWRGE